jgi:hypothetical protein
VEVDKQDDKEEKDIFKGVNRTKQVERLRRKAERIREFLKGNGERIGRTGKEIRSNVTDKESANMMTSHGVVQGYNGQAVVDGKLDAYIPNIKFRTRDPRFATQERWQFSRGKRLGRIFSIGKSGMSMSVRRGRFCIGMGIRRRRIGRSVGGM